MAQPPVFSSHKWQIEKLSKLSNHQYIRHAMAAIIISLIRWLTKQKQTRPFSNPSIQAIKQVLHNCLQINIPYYSIGHSNLMHFCRITMVTPQWCQKPWWRHQMETFSALLAICAGNSPVPGEFPAQRPVTRSFDVFFDLRLNKRLSEQSWGWWFETLSRTLWRHCNNNNGARSRDQG